MTIMKIEEIGGKVREGKEITDEEYGFLIHGGYSIHDRRVVKTRREFYINERDEVI